MEKARELMRGGDLDGAGKIYENLYLQPGGGKDQALIYNLLYALNKAGNYGKAIEIGIRACGIPGVWQGIRQNTAWCIYFGKLKNAVSLPPEQAAEWLEKIREIHPQRPGLHPLVLGVFTYVSGHAGLEPEFAVQLCGLLDPKMLSPRPAAAEGRRDPFPSEREKYTGILSKALYASEDYRACLSLCESFLSAGFPISPNNSLWLRRRIALCHWRLGMAAEALDEMKQIISEKKDWFLVHETAAIARDLGRFGEAFSYALKAALAPGRIEHKVHLWELIRFLLSREKKYEESIELLKLGASIRKFKNWKIGTRLEKELAEYNIPLDRLPHFSEIHRSAMKWLPGMGYNDALSLEGKITRILPHNKAGFICEGGRSYYFRARDCQFPANRLIPGQEVLFCPETGFDPKKQKETAVAACIRLKLPCQ